MIPTGSSLIRLGEHNGKIIRVYRKGQRVFVSEGKKHRESCNDSWAIEAMPERLKAWVMNEIYSRETVVKVNRTKNFWAT